MKQGFIITAKGWEILAKAMAGSCKLKIAGVAFGSGKVETGENPATYTALKSPIADGTYSHLSVTTEKDETGEVKQSTISFIAEYRSDYSGECPITNKAPVDIDYDFALSEFGIYAEDPANGEYVLIYYATLGDTPHPVTSASKGARDIRRYPVSIAISKEIEVSLIYPPLAFVTSEEMQNYAQQTCKPQFLQLSKAQVEEHDVDPNAHQNLRNYVSTNDERITALEKLLSGSASAPFRCDFNTLDGVVLNVGVYNAAEAKIEF